MTKYNNKKIVIDGIKFDSKLESSFYIYLKALNLELTLQPKFNLQPSFKIGVKTYRAIDYLADFSFTWRGQILVIDAKGMETEIFKIKRKLLLFRYPGINFYAVKNLKAFKALLATTLPL